ncbi:hypothetical protein Peur_063693 [Populus x canadensis]
MVLDPRLNEAVKFPRHGLSLCGLLKILRVAFSRRGLPICRNCLTFCTKCCLEAEICYTCVYKLTILQRKWS